MGSLKENGTCETGTEWWWEDREELEGREWGVDSIKTDYTMHMYEILKQ